MPTPVRIATGRTRRRSADRSASPPGPEETSAPSPGCTGFGGAGRVRRGGGTAGSGRRLPGTPHTDPDRVALGRTTVLAVVRHRRNGPRDPDSSHAHEGTPRSRDPLTSQLARHLAAQPRFGDSPFVFPSANGGPISNMTIAMAMRRTGLHAVPHGWALDISRLGDGIRLAPRARRATARPSGRQYDGAQLRQGNTDRGPSADARGLGSLRPRSSSRLRWSHVEGARRCRGHVLGPRLRCPASAGGRPSCARRTPSGGGRAGRVALITLLISASPCFASTSLASL